MIPAPLIAPLAEALTAALVAALIAPLAEALMAALIRLPRCAHSWGATLAC